MTDKVKMIVHMDMFQVEVPNGLSEKKLKKKVHKEVLKAVASGRVGYGWTGKKVENATICLEQEVGAESKRCLVNISLLDKADIEILVDKAGSIYQLGKSTGLQYSQIQNYLTGKTNPSVASLQKLNEFKSVEVENA